MGKLIHKKKVTKKFFTQICIALLPCLAEYAVAAHLECTPDISAFGNNYSYELIRADQYISIYKITLFEKTVDPFNPATLDSSCTMSIAYRVEEKIYKYDAINCLIEGDPVFSADTTTRVSQHAAYNPYSKILTRDEASGSTYAVLQGTRPSTLTPDPDREERYVRKYSRKYSDDEIHHKGFSSSYLYQTRRSEFESYKKTELETKLKGFKQEAMPNCDPDLMPPDLDNEPTEIGDLNKRNPCFSHEAHLWFSYKTEGTDSDYSISGYWAEPPTVVDRANAGGGLGTIRRLEDKEWEKIKIKFGEELINTLMEDWCGLGAQRTTRMTKIIDPLNATAQSTPVTYYLYLSNIMADTYFDPHYEIFMLGGAFMVPLDDSHTYPAADPGEPENPTDWGNPNSATDSDGTNNTDSSGGTGSDTNNSNDSNTPDNNSDDSTSNDTVYTPTSLEEAWALAEETRIFAVGLRPRAKSQDTNSTLSALDSSVTSLKSGVSAGLFDRKEQKIISRLHKAIQRLIQNKDRKRVVKKVKRLIIKRSKKLKRLLLS